MSREQIVAEMRERANDLREQGKLASANAMDDFADRLAALTASPQAAPEGGEYRIEHLDDSHVRLTPIASPQMQGVVAWRAKVPGGEWYDGAPSADTVADYARLGMSIQYAYGSPQVQVGESARDWSLRMAEKEAGQITTAGGFGIPDEPQRAPGVIDGEELLRLLAGIRSPASCNGEPLVYRASVLELVRRRVDEARAALASGPSGVCHHRWQPEIDLDGALYCPKCNATRDRLASGPSGVDDALEGHGGECIGWWRGGNFLFANPDDNVSELMDEGWQPVALIPPSTAFSLPGAQDQGEGNGQ